MSESHDNLINPSPELNTSSNQDTPAGWSRDKIKSIWSAVFMALFVLFLLLAMILGWLSVSFTFLLISVCCLIVAGFPWGISLLWPFWLLHLGGFHFGIIWFGGIWVLISLIIDVLFFCAKWIIFFFLCVVIGWISMFVHTGLIVQNVKDTGIFNHFKKNK